jgi:RecB family exonuclease
VYSNSGSQVFFSGAQDTGADTHIPPGFFMAEGLVMRPEGPPAEDTRDPYAAETFFWKTGGDGSRSDGLPLKLYPLQETGFQGISRASLQEKGKDYTRSGIADEDLVNILMESQKDADSGLFSVSPARLDRYSRCPFSYLFTNILKVREETYSIETRNPLKEGIFFHQVLKEYFDQRKETDMTEIIRVCLDAWEREGDAYLPAVKAELEERTKTLMGRFLDADKQTYPEDIIAGTELELSAGHPDLAALLSGRIDRVSESKDGYTLIDYKRKIRFSKNDLTGDAPVTFQMPFYVLLCTLSGMEIRNVSYYDISGGKYLHVLNPDQKSAAVDEKGFEELLGLMNRNIESMIEGAKTGMYGTSMPEKGCDPCDLRAVCRKKFIIR